MSDARKKRQAKKRRKAGKPSDQKGDRKKKPGKWPGAKPNLIAALNHKLRRQLLRVLHRCDDPISPVNLSDRLGISVSKISYHIKVLKKFGVIALVNEQQVRGAIEHFYVSQVADHPSVRKMLDETEAEDEGKT